MTDNEIIHYHDTRLNLTLKELSLMTGKSVAELKKLLLSGSTIAKQCGWEGEAITKVFFEALTDANYHTLRSRLEDAYNNYLEEIK
jgi:hypothetical protein